MAGTPAVLDWRQRDEWLNAVDEYASDVLTRNVKSAIARRRPECWSDSFSWLPVAEGEQLFLEAFRRFYGNVKAFHGCRPFDVGSYLANGLRVQDPADLEAQFRTIFADAPISAVESALSEARPEPGRSWVVLSDDDLLQNCGHYLIQGSEYLMELATRLSRLCRAEDYTKRLRDRGIPTILELDVPVADIPEPHLRSVARFVLSEWGAKVARRRTGWSVTPCLTLRNDIGAQHIIRHWHPMSIVDPHRSRLRYHNVQVSCPHCP